MRLTRARSLRAAVAGALLAGGLLSAATPAVAATTTVATSRSYPYARSNPNGVDPWGDYYRQCTSYAAWWLTSHGVRISAMSRIKGPKGAAVLLDAKNWDKAARQAGFAVSSKPVVGAIAQWRANERTSVVIPHGRAYFMAASTGHVAVVRKVYPDGSALLEDYNGAVPLGLHSYRGRAPRYLLIHT